jgi:hypothetical protein
MTQLVTIKNFKDEFHILNSNSLATSASQVKSYAIGNQFSMMNGSPLISIRSWKTAIFVKMVAP